MILQPIASLSVCMLLYTSELQEIARKRYTIEYMEAARMYVLGYLR
jgi:hypothetical protein